MEEFLFFFFLSKRNEALSFPPSPLRLYVASATTVRREESDLKNK